MRFLQQSGLMGAMALGSAWALLVPACSLAQQPASSAPPAAVAPAVDAPVAPPALDPVVQGARETLSLLQARGLTPDPTQARRGVVEAVLRSVDPHAMLLDGEAARVVERQAAGVYTDIGVDLMVSNGMAFVTSVKEGSPAAEQGLQAGDRIRQIGATAVTNLDVMTVTRLFRAGEAEEVAMVVDRPGAPEPLPVTMKRRATQFGAVAERRELPNDLCYLRLNALLAGTGEEVTGILRGWAEARRVGVVLDLRGAGGDDLDSAAALAGLVGEPRSFLFSLRDAQDREIRVANTAPGAALGMPLVVLVDEETKRAAELLAATLRGSGRGVILVGRRTAGDPEVRERVPLAENEWAYVAVRKLVVGSGEEYTGSGGVQPHVVVSPESTAYAEVTPPPPLLTDRRKTTEAEQRMELLREHTKGDAVLTRAVDILLGLRALNLHGYGRRTAD